MIYLLKPKISYKTRLEAENAEMAQCAEINARYQQQEINDLRRQMKYTQDHRNDESIAHLWQYVQHLENRIKQLENPYAEL